MVRKVCWNNRYLVEDRYTSRKVERSFRDFLQNLPKSYKRSNFFERYNIQQLFLVVSVYRKSSRSLPNGTSAWTKFVRKLLFVGNVFEYAATEDCSMLVQRRRSLQFLRSTKPVNIFLIIVKWNWTIQLRKDCKRNVASVQRLLLLGLMGSFSESASIVQQRKFVSRWFLRW